MNKKDFLWGFLTLLLTTGILFIVSKFKDIPVIWILSPFWETILMILLAITMAFLRTLISVLWDLIKYHKDQKVKVIEKER